MGYLENVCVNYVGEKLTLYNSNRFQTSMIVADI